MGAATFEHKGIQIKLEANGKFSAQTPTGRITAASLDAIKKRLDKPADFEPFKAFTIKWGSRIEDCTVTGIVKGRARYQSDQFQTDRGPVGPVFLDTPENRAAVAAYFDLQAKHKAIREQQDAELQAKYDAITRARPGDPLPNQPA